MKYTIFDIAAWMTNGLILGLLVWFIHSSYKTARAEGYTPDSRAFMNELVSKYNSPNTDDINNIPRLTVKDLK
jgi:hypothetical protein